MRLPISAKTLFRLHRKLFMLRIPCKPSRSACSLAFAPDGKSPLVRLRVEKNRTPILQIAFTAAAILFAALITWGKE